MHTPSIVCSTALEDFQSKSVGSLFVQPPSSKVLAELELLLDIGSNIELQSPAVLKDCTGFMGFKGLKLKFAAKRGNEGFQFSP